MTSIEVDPGDVLFLVEDPDNEDMSNPKLVVEVEGASIVLCDPQKASIEAAWEYGIINKATIYTSESKYHIDWITRGEGKCLLKSSAA